MSVEQNPYREEDEPRVPNTMSSLLKKFPVEKKVVRGIHSEEHELAKQISEYYHEPKRFGMWLGITKKYGTQAVYRAWAEVKQSNANKPVMLLMWKIKQYGKKEDAKADSAREAGT